MANHYETLNLHSNQAVTLTPQALKQAYRKALLAHHPDKSPHPEAKPNVTPSPTITVDQINTAYKILSNPSTKASYDRELLLLHQSDRRDSHGLSGNSANGGVATGLEVVDLDSLDYHERSQTWTRSCRCGETAGFVVTERDLEENAAGGEMLVGCKGCSLWLKVLFGIDDEDDAEDDGLGS